MGAGITYKGKYYAAGLSVGAEVNAAGAVSTRILASADQFAVLNPATNGYTLPFLFKVRKPSLFPRSSKMHLLLTPKSVAIFSQTIMLRARLAGASIRMAC